VTVARCSGPAGRGAATRGELDASARTRTWLAQQPLRWITWMSQCT